MQSIEYNDKNYRDFQDEIIQTRMTLITLPEQSGKTYLMINELKSYVDYSSEISEDKPESVKSVDFIFCSNSLLLTQQTAKRIDEAEFGYEIFSSKNSECKTAADVKNMIMMEDKCKIICCTNAARIKDICKIIKDFNTSSVTKDKYKFRIWIDEADQYVSQIKDKFIPLCEKYENIFCWLLTATPEPFFKKFKTMHVFPNEDTTQPNYHGWKDNVIEIMEDGDTREEFITYVLDNNRDLIQPETAWFIPAKHKKISHHHVKSLCLGFGFAVITVNGDGVSLDFPDDKPSIHIEKDQTLDKIISSLYSEYDLTKYPVAITGLLCIGRAITFMSPEFRFDYAILSSTGKKATDSQLAGRVKGNMKDWLNYKKPVVFTTAKFDKAVTLMEEKSRNLGKLAYARLLEGQPTIVTESEYNNIEVPDGHFYYKEERDTWDEVLEFFQDPIIWKTEMGLNKIPNPQPTWNKIKPQCGGYLIATRIPRTRNKTRITRPNLRANDRLTRDEADNFGPKQNIKFSTMGNGTHHTLIIPIYETRDSPPESAKYQIRYRAKNQKIINTGLV